MCTPKAGNPLHDLAMKTPMGLMIAARDRDDAGLRRWANDPINDRNAIALHLRRREQESGNKSALSSQSPSSPKERGVPQYGDVAGGKRKRSLLNG